jgi:hypothetical protein
MKKSSAFTLAAMAAISAASAQSLYYVGDEAQESIPLKWSVGMTAIYDSNMTPGTQSGQPGFEDDAWSLNPYAAATFTSITPQTTIDLYARAGVNYYLTSSEIDGADDTTFNGRLGFDLTHRFSERLRFSSRNFAAQEMEPEYAYGQSAQRGVDPYTLWSSDNSVGYRWTERLGSYTGITFTGFLGDGVNSDRSSFSLYQQMRYQLTPRTVATAEYRYTAWTGDASDSTNHFITGGFEHRLSPTSIFVVSAGAQLREVDGGDSSTSPFFEAALSSQINTRFSVRGFARYSIEDFDTVQQLGAFVFEYQDQRVLRIGLNGSYSLTPRLSGFGGVDLVSTGYGSGITPDGVNETDGESEDVINAYVGLRAKISDSLTTECSINCTDSVSDFEGREYDRLRLSAGVSYSF